MTTASNHVFWTKLCNLPEGHKKNSSHVAKRCQNLQLCSFWIQLIVVPEYDAEITNLHGDLSDHEMVKHTRSNALDYLHCNNFLYFQHLHIFYTRELNIWDEL